MLPDPVPHQRNGLDEATCGLLNIVGAPPEGGTQSAGHTAKSVKALWATAVAQELDALVAESISRSGAADSASWAPLRHELERSRIVAMARWAWLQEGARAVLRPLTNAEVPVVPIKGIWVAERYYAPHYVRSMGDLDFVIGGSVMRAATVLERAGATRAQHDPAIQAYEETVGMEVTLVGPRAAGPLVELHWRLYPEQPPETAQALLDHADAGLCAGVATATPSHTDQLLVSAHHLLIGRGSAAPLWRWWLDIDRMVRDAATDWDALMSRAEAWADSAPLALALAGATQLFGTPVPRDAWRNLVGLLTAGERRIVGDAVEHGAWRVSRDAMLAQIWRDRPVGWRKRSVLALLWPHPGEVAMRLQVSTRDPGFWRHRIRFAQTRAAQMLRVGARRVASHLSRMR